MPDVMNAMVSGVTVAPGALMYAWKAFNVVAVVTSSNWPSLYIYASELSVVGSNTPTNSGSVAARRAPADETEAFTSTISADNAATDAFSK